MSLPKVAIVGRPNVGKSSLLNALSGRRIAIVDSVAGITRDRISVPLELRSGYVELVDTGGMGIEDVDDLTDQVEQQITYGIGGAEVIIFMVDARDGILPLDKHVTEKLRKQNKPVILIANKVDQAQLASEIGEMQKLGFGDPIATSTTHNKGLDELIDRLNDELAHVAHGEAPEHKMRLAIVGKRNAGKSTFINALAGDDRVIVSEVPGTTRDSVDVTVEINGKSFLLIDTAGVLKRKKMNKDVEFYSFHRAMRSSRRADVVAMMIDASVPISQVDKLLARKLTEEFKPVVLVVNKWDLARDKADGDEFVEYFEKVLPEMRYAPISLTSATNNENLQQTVELALDLYKQSTTRVTTGELNQVIADILALRGPSNPRGQKPPKIYYATQIATAPPTVVLFVNDPASFDRNYQRFLLNQFRERLPFGEIPMRLLFRRHRKTREEAKRDS